MGHIPIYKCKQYSGIYKKEKCKEYSETEGVPFSENPEHYLMRIQLCLDTWQKSRKGVEKFLNLGHSFDAYIATVVFFWIFLSHFPTSFFFSCFFSHKPPYSKLVFLQNDPLMFKFQRKVVRNLRLHFPVSAC